MPEAVDGGSPEALASLIRSLDASRREPPGARVVKRPEAPPPPPDQIGYVVDLPKSTASGLHVLVVERKLAPGKPPAPWEELSLTEARVERCSDPDDRAILQALREATSSTASMALIRDEGHIRGKPPRGPSRFTLSRAARERIVPMLARTDRCRLRRTPEERASLLLRWSDAPWQLRLRVGPADAAVAGEDWDVAGVLRRGTEMAALAEIDMLFEGGLVILRGAAGRLDDGGASSWLGMLRQHPKVRITQSRRAAFFEELYGLPAPPPLDLPDGAALPEIAIAPTPRLAFAAPAELESAPPSPWLYADLAFDYEGFAVPARKAGKVVYDGLHNRLIRRDLAAEAVARARPAELGFQPVPSPGGRPSADAQLQLPAGKLPLIVATLGAEGWQVEAAGRRYRRTVAFSGKLRSGIDWLDLDGQFDFDGVRVDLPKVLAAAKRGDGAVLLDDGTLGMLPDEWLSRNGVLARLGEAKDGKLRFKKSQMTLVDVLVNGEPGVTVDDAFAKARVALDDVKLSPADPPEGFLGTLRAYQREGLGWLHFLERCGVGGCLADEMGLGKTVQILALLAGRPRGKPSLVVAPRSLVFNWKREAARFAPELRVLDFTGDGRGAPGVRFAGHDLVLTTYGTLRRDAEALSAVELDYAILDEAQAIKNDASETSRAARRLRADHRLCLSGTPVENHLGELWSIFEFLNPGVLGRATAFRAATADRSTNATALLARALRPFLLRRTKRQVAKDLPDRLEETRLCELEPPQRALYDEMAAHYRNELRRRVSEDGMGRARIQVLEALLRLRQAACHPGLIDPARRGERSAKLDILLAELPMLRENGQKALVFSQFTSLLGIVRAALDELGIPYEYLDGATRDREARVERFQNDPACAVFLISLKAGGVGLNLTAAEYVYLLDPWWNPAAEAQAIDRAHRIGQTRAVFAYRLIAKDTIEERISELQRTKRALAESVIAGDGGLLGELDAADLDLLLS